MNEENGTTVELNVLLKSSLFSALHVVSEAAIHEAEGSTHSVEDKEFENWPVDIEQHSTNKGSTNLIKPFSVEVGESSVS